MKSLYLLICLTLIVLSGNLPTFSQNFNNRKVNPDRPILFTPKNHDPNFLKSGKISEKSFYQRKSEWKHIIDTTWGPGAPLAEKLQIYNTYAKAIREKFDGFNSLKLNWDSLYNHYLSKITESTSKGAFSSIMSHFAYHFKDLHTQALDSSVVYSALNPGKPILLIGSYLPVEHFGAVTTVLSDSTTLVLRVAPNHPLNLEPGDIILGYEGVPWKNLVRELLDAGLPMVATTGGCKSADTYQNLSGAGLNWHLFSTIDILKYSTRDTLHLTTLPLINFNVPIMVNNEQLAIKNIPFPHFYYRKLLYREHDDSDILATFGILENTNIGYIYLANEWPTDIVEAQFFEAINSLKNTDALIIDMRLNFGGSAVFDKAFNILYNEYHKTLELVYRCNTNTFELCPGGYSTAFQIDGKDPDYYDRPIAILLGPTCVSNGDWNAHRFKYHPMVRFFGASPDASLGDNRPIESFSGWNLYYSIADAFHVSQPGVYLNRKEFPIDFPVWFNKDDVAKGIDPIVTKSLSWINNLAYGHDISTEKGRYSPGNDTIKINAIIENPNTHNVVSKLIFEKLDGSVVDSTEMIPLKVTAANDWQGKWITKGIPENIYWVSLKVTDQTTGTSFTNKHITRITTIPLVLDKLVNAVVSDNKFTFQPQFKNDGETTDILDITVTLTSTDPLVKAISPDQTTLLYLKPGQTRRTAGFTVTSDAATFPKSIHLTFNLSKDGWTYWVIDTTVFVSPTGIEPVESHPLANLLEQNYPNPFNSVTTIIWQLAHSSRATLKVLDIVGRTVATLVDEQRPQGKYETQFNATALPKGVYFYQLKAGEFSQTRKMVLMK